MRISGLSDSSAIIVLQPSWENLITSAPAVVAILGSLMVASTRADFSLERSKPIGGFKYITNPSSFRATLVQISNEGWDAFHEAHVNMDKIQLYMEQVPNRIKSALRIVDRDVKQIKRLLPIPMKSIKEMAYKSAGLADATHKGFMNIMLLLGEVIKVTTNQRGIHSRELLDVQYQLEASLAASERMKDIRDKLEKKAAEFEKDVHRYQKEYKDAMDDIPTGWNAILKQLAYAGVGFLKGFTDSLFGGSQRGAAATQETDVDDKLDGSSTRGLIRVFMEQFKSNLDIIHKKFKAIFKAGRAKVEDNPALMFSRYKTLLGNWTKQISESDGKSVAQEKKSALIVLQVWLLTFLTF